MIVTEKLIITDEQKRQYQEEGFFILNKVIPEEELDLIRKDCMELKKWKS